MSKTTASDPNWHVRKADGTLSGLPDQNRDTDGSRTATPRTGPVHRLRSQCPRAPLRLQGGNLTVARLPSFESLPPGRHGGVLDPFHLPSAVSPPLIISALATISGSGRPHAAGILVRVGQRGKKMPHAVKTGALLVVGLDDGPRRVGSVRVEKHRLLGRRVLVPLVERLAIHRRQLPLLQSVLTAGLEAALLLLSSDGEPVLEQQNPAPDEHAFQLGGPDA